jgi:hypothetical protein
MPPRPMLQCCRYVSFSFPQLTIMSVVDMQPHRGGRSKSFHVKIYACAELGGPRSGLAEVPRWRLLSGVTSVTIRCDIRNDIS